MSPVCETANPLTPGLVVSGEIARFLRMMCRLLICVIIALTLTSRAAVRQFDFSAFPAGQFPTGFVSKASGSGRPGDWKIIETSAPSAFAPLTPEARAEARQHVLAQVGRMPDDEHFPLLLHEGEEYGDFTFRTKFKCVEGKVEQMAGLAFRARDERNYYVVRASALGNTFRFYKFVDGVRSAPIGPEIPVPRGEWHEMAVECKGNVIRCLLNGKEAIPALTDNSFQYGKVGFWTKSDSVSYFAGAEIEYVPRQILAQTLVLEVMQRKPSVVDVKIFMRRQAGGTITAVAASDQNGVGETAGDVENEVFLKDANFHGRDATRVTVTVPLHDRNGDVVAALRVIRKRFFGETESTSVFRGVEIARELEARFTDARQLLE